MILVKNCKEFEHIGLKDFKKLLEYDNCVFITYIDPIKQRAKMIVL